jgi:hypothetical protein
LTKVIGVLEFLYGTGWEADDRQGDGAGKGNLPALHFLPFSHAPMKSQRGQPACTCGAFFRCRKNRLLQIRDLQFALSAVMF